MASTDMDFKRAGWQLDLGEGNRIDAEFSADGQLWLAVGEATEDLSAWFKRVSGFDIRVGIERRSDGLAITIDRGENQPAWWSQDDSPVITLRLDGQGSVTVAAKGEAMKQEVILARRKV